MPRRRTTTPAPVPPRARTPAARLKRRTARAPRRRTFFVAALAFLCLWPLASSAGAQRRARGARQRRPAAVARFVAGQGSSVVPFDLVDNLILVRASVNESGPLWFIFDTGASHTVIDGKQAAALRLRSRGRIVGEGSAGTAAAARLEPARLRLGGVEVTGLTTYALALDFLAPPLGRPISGVVGNDVIGRFVVEIDYGARTLNFVEQRGYVYAGRGAPVPVTIEGDGNVFARAEVSFVNRPHLTGKFEIDTGSTGTVSVNAPFVRRHRLERAVGDSRVTRMGGVGGTAEALLARALAVRLGGYELRAPVVRLSRATRGSLAATQADGIIGGEIFRRFSLTVDLARRRIYLEPGAEFTEPFEDDMSGIELLGDGPDFKTYLIDDVEAGSAAAEAGVEGGDVLTAIDDRPASEFTLDEIRRMFRQDGREYALELRRGERDVRVRLKLRRRV
jgi:hypothetical protein